MELYSKRNSGIRRTGIILREDNKNSFLNSSLRKRLQEEVRYCIQSNKFLEPFLIVKNEKDESFYLHDKTLSDLSSRELGYDISDSIHPEKLTFPEDDKINDYHFFDLIELLLIFCRDEERNKLASRISSIFSEEDDNFTIHQFMVFRKGDTNLRSLVPLIKNKNLANKLRDFYSSDLALNPNQEVKARNSADIVQNIFSAPTKKEDTKKYSESICLEVASKNTTKANVKNLASLLNETVLNAKKLSNEIANIRHTDQTTIPVKSPDLYSLIAMKNIRIAELVILSLPEKFIASQDPETMKENYLNRYSISKDTAWVLKKPETQIPIISEEDLPF